MRAPLGSVGLAMIAASALIKVAGPVAAQQPSFPSRSIITTVDPILGYVVEASQRFGIPATWIRAVMRVESDGEVGVTSSAGAMGLMQVMPETYATLRARFGLRSDAYDPRNNIIAGTAYLREMHDRYGDAGFLAAYNAGPARYEEFRAGGRPLPLKTILYMARLGPTLGVGGSMMWTDDAQTVVVTPEEAPILVTFGNRPVAGGLSPNLAPSVQLAAAELRATTQAPGLFTARRMQLRGAATTDKRLSSATTSSTKQRARPLNLMRSPEQPDNIFVHQNFARTQP